MTFFLFVAFSYPFSIDIRCALFLLQLNIWLPHFACLFYTHSKLHWARICHKPATQIKHYFMYSVHAGRLSAILQSSSSG